MANLTPLSIDGAWLYETTSYEDARGYFQEWFKESLIREVLGREFKVTQANLSRSKKGVVRGIHFSTASQGQAKWITCTNGFLWDVVVDIRPHSPTFKSWEAVELHAGDGKSLLISEGLGHAFVALEDDTVISYLLTTAYSPQDEFAINPLDAELGITWPDIPLIFSERDFSASSIRNYIGH